MILDEQKRQHALDHFVRLARCGLMPAACEAEKTAFRLATMALGTLDEIDPIAVRGLAEFIAVAKLQPDVARDFLCQTIHPVQEFPKQQGSLKELEVGP